MANKDASFGMKPIGSYTGTGPTIVLNKYIIAAGDGTDLFVGDPVNLGGTALLDLIDGVTYPTVTKATAGTGNFFIGCITSFIPETDSSLLYKTDAVTQRSVWVADDPNQLYLMQADGIVAVTDVSETADLIFTNSGSTATGLSGAEFKTADIGTGSQITIVRLPGVSETGNNDISSANANWVVRISEHQHTNTSTGA